MPSMWHLLVDVYYQMNKTIPYEELYFHVSGDNTVNW